MITGVDPIKFAAEKVNNITIKLGFANAKIFECANCHVPKNYFSEKSSCEDTPPCPHCKKRDTKLVRHISIIDCPGHHDYMTTMLSGVAAMDGTLLLISAEQKCP